jgi:glutaredoxin 3
MSAKVEIYTRSLCGFCTSAKCLLDTKKVDYTEIDVTLDSTVREAMAERSDGRTTLPQIFINGEGIGGCNELYALDRNGKLDGLLA